MRIAMFFIMTASLVAQQTQPGGGGGGGGGGGAVGAVDHVQTAGTAGAFKDGGCTALSGVLTCPPPAGGVAGSATWNTGTTPATPASGNVAIYPDSSSRMNAIDSGGNSYRFPITIGSGQITLPTAAISGGASSSVVTVTVAGALATDQLKLTSAVGPLSQYGAGFTVGAQLTIDTGMSSGGGGFQYVLNNNTSTSITPASGITLNWLVERP